MSGCRRTGPARSSSPSPSYGETCNFLRNHVRNGPLLESRFLDSATKVTPAFEIVGPTPDDRRRAADLVEQPVSAPLGYVDATVIAMAERLKVSDVATVDFKFLGMASQVSLINPLRFVLQET